MAWKTLDDMDLQDKVVLTRVDINVPVEDGRVTDATRIERIVPTVRDILAAGGKPVLMAHFGRPKGKVVPEMSLRMLVPALEAALGMPVRFAADCVGAEAESAVGALRPGEVLLLENTRFHAEEEKNDPAFAASPRRSATSTATTPSRRRTGRMPRPRRWRGCCPPAPGG
jgi:phosphoglycerate kinase